MKLLSKATAASNNDGGGGASDAATNGDNARGGEKRLDQIAELVDASMKFTRVLKRKGVSQATLNVAVRARPLSRAEMNAGARTITRLVDEKCVVIMDPDEDDAETSAAPGRPKPTRRKEVAAGVRKRERRYVFDNAYDGDASNEQVYAGTVLPLIAGVLRGTNATVFAYGATGSGKTHTMVGDQTDPGLMVLSLRDVFRYIARDSHDKDYTVECSYTEVYNELVYDLLVPNSGALELREDPEKGPTVSGLTHVKVEDERQIFSLLREGNARRKTEETGANAVSSRSHAVLEIWVTRSERNHYCKSFSTGKLALVDLAGAERASETNNRGQQLRDGANINRSLLSLANCINALGKRKKKGFVFVPFRDSKLTRILKDGLCGNSRTVMVATVSGSSHQYEHTVNTLKYADRAKEIKTLVQENRGTVETHIAEYQRMIDALQEERRELKAEVSRLSNGGGGGVTGTGGGSSTAGGGVTGVNGRGTTSHASQSQSQSSPENSATSTYMSAQEVEKFAQELAEATDACAKAQRVLLESMHEPEPSTPNVGRASKKYAAAASALEALAPVNLAVDVAMITHSGAGASSRSSSRPSTGGSRAAAAPVSASDLAVLHARAALAVAADYDNLALDARDKLIEDQRQTIQYLMRLLQTRANIVDEDDLDLPENCGISQLDARYRALTRDWESSKSKKNGKKGKKQSETTTLATDGHGASVVPLGAIRIEAEALAARARATESNSVVANGGNKHSRKHSFGGGGGFELEYDVSELNLAEVDSIDDSISDRSGSSRSVSPPGGVNAAIGAPNGCLSPVHENVAKNGGGGSDRPRGGQKAAKAAKAATAEKAHAKPSPYAPGGGGGGVGGGASRRDSIAKRLNRVMTKQKARKEAAAA